MPHSQSSWPFERPEQLTDALREQGASPEECADLLPAMHRLSEWQAPQPEPADTRRLIARLMTALPTHSPVRQAIRSHRQHRVAFLLTTARAQVSLFGLDFWLVSALVTLLGAVVVLRSNVLPTQELVLRASGPLLAYLGTLVAFRGRGMRVLELELVCLPSPLQLALARLVIVLGYDIGLSLALSLMLWAGGAGQVLALTLAWLMPLLLVVGLALLLSLRLSVQVAASLAYGSWLTFLAIGTISPLQMFLLMPALLVLLGCIGLALLAIALLRMHADMHRLLPYS
ncbi:hypothetical protein [Ktedonobacter racemifer]|uniref:Uncharacterized protein n=1 Tax=Ktedonobacter racemifer DSM 44963 TaxID=485913 RepID=D6U8Y0_KTERA|nr:hypothetical protein [Ktedonobacter racemifer]EFH79588.1 conserved hypothetical protein [Ktedonobacter racemifer DSM 44963]